MPERVPRVLIDAGNLVGGGGLQVGQSFLEELARGVRDDNLVNRFAWLEGVKIAVCPELEEQLDPLVNQTFQVGRAARYWRLPGRRHDLAFTIFGPRYGPASARVEVGGFADITSLMSGRLDPRTGATFKRRLRRHLSRRYFRSLDGVIVESPFLVDELVSRWGVARERVSVVPNTLNARIAKASLPVVATPDGTWNLLYVARGYAHKNHAFLARLADELRASHAITVQFIVTLPPDEWTRLPQDVRDHCRNVGAVPIDEVPKLHEAADGVIFPSLLECFSATPLEAMALSRPVFASDRNFVRDVCGGAANYFEPTDVITAAAQVAGAMAQPAILRDRVQEGRTIATGWPTARTRMLGYLDLMDAALGGYR